MRILQQNYEEKMMWRLMKGIRVFSLLTFVSRGVRELAKIFFLDDMRYIYADLAALGIDIPQELYKDAWNEEPKGSRSKYNKGLVLESNGPKESMTKWIVRAILTLTHTKCLLQKARTISWL